MVIQAYFPHDNSFYLFMSPIICKEHNLVTYSNSRVKLFIIILIYNIKRADLNIKQYCRLSVEYQT